MLTRLTPCISQRRLFLKCVDELFQGIILKQSKLVPFFTAKFIHVFITPNRMLCFSGHQNIMWDAIKGVLSTYTESSNWRSLNSLKLAIVNINTCRFVYQWGWCWANNISGMSEVEVMPYVWHQLGYYWFQITSGYRPWGRGVQISTQIFNCYTKNSWDLKNFFSILENLWWPFSSSLTTFSNSLNPITFPQNIIKNYLFLIPFTHIRNYIIIYFFAEGPELYC